MTTSTSNDGVSADFLILADSAQVHSDKLFMLGGGWSLVWAKDFPVQHQMAIAAGILVPWLATNQRHRFEVKVRTEHGQMLAEIGGEFEQGRPPGLPQGATQRVILAMNLSVRLESAVEAVAELSLDGTVAKEVPFRVVALPTR